VLEQSDRSRVERRREAVEDAGEAVVGPDAEAVTGKLGQDLLLGGERLGRPAPLGGLGSEPQRRDALGDRGRLEDDDVPPCDVDGGAPRADEAVPPPRARVARRVLSPSVL